MALDSSVEVVLINTKGMGYVKQLVYEKGVQSIDYSDRILTKGKTFGSSYSGL